MCCLRAVFCFPQILKRREEVSKMGGDKHLPIRVYVAGSIAETLDAQEWRVEWKKQLESMDLGLVVVDPLIEREGRGFGEVAYEENTAYILINDRLLLESCHVLLIISDLVTPTVGTWVELAWARDKGLYIILFVTNPDYPEKRRLNLLLRRMCDKIIFGDKGELRQTFEHFQHYDRKLL